MTATTKYQKPAPEITGWMGDDELQWLFELGTRGGRPGIVVEVGCWFGRSTHALASSGALVYAVDHFHGSPTELEGAHAFAKTGNVKAEFDKNMGQRKNMRVMAMDSTTAARQFAPKGVDAVFIDGEHTLEACLTDLRSWAPKVKVGGLLCGHDRDQSGVPVALKEFFGFPPRTVVGSIWAMEKTEEGWREL